MLKRGMNDEEALGAEDVDALQCPPSLNSSLGHFTLIKSYPMLFWGISSRDGCLALWPVKQLEFEVKSLPTNTNIFFSIVEQWDLQNVRSLAPFSRTWGSKRGHHLPLCPPSSSSNSSDFEFRNSSICSKRSPFCRQMFLVQAVLDQVAPWTNYFFLYLTFRVFKMQPPSWGLVRIQ